MKEKWWLTDPAWWKMAGERAIRSLAQGILVGIGECVIMQDVNWMMALSMGGLMAVVSILTSIAFGMPEYNKDGDSE